jgi:hypothetical protein
MRGHIKLFKLQMNLDRARQKMAESEDACFGTCHNEVSSLQHIFLPSLKITSVR